MNTEKNTVHFNFMDGESYDINNPILRLRVMASSCYFNEPKYYNEENKNEKIFNYVSRTVSGNDLNYLYSILNGDEKYFMFESNLDLRHSLINVIDKALDFNPEMTLKEAVYLRTIENMRTTPQIIMVRAANHPKVKGTNLIRLYAQKIMVRADEPAVQLAYQMNEYGKPIPNSLKKAWKSKLEGLSEFQLNKYKLQNKKIKTVDVVNVCHATSEPINKLMKGNLVLSANDTWETLISTSGSNKENWEKALGLMAHTALLKNLRNFKEHGVDMAPVYKKLLETAKGSKMMPFHYYMAYNALRVAGYANDFDKDEISKVLEISMGELPKFAGKVISLSDNSGSAQNTCTSEFGKMKVSTIGNLSAILTAKNSDEGYVGIFGNNLKIIKVEKDTNVFDALDNMEIIAQEIGQGTENGIWLFFKDALKNKDDYSNIFVYSDMQAGHGGLYGINPKEYENFQWNKSKNIDVASLIKTYRKDINKETMFFLVQTAGYGDSLVPEFYKNTYILGGWSSQIIKFASKMREINKLL